MWNKPVADLLAELFNYKLYLFDVDKTLVNFNDTELLPHAVDFFSRIKGDHKKAVHLVTNQGGPAWRNYAQQNNIPGWEKFPTEEEVIERLNQIWEQLVGLCGLNVRYHTAFAFRLKDGTWTHPDGQGGDEWRWDWRKPNGGMLKYAMYLARCNPHEALMIGDSADDEGAAQAAGVKFMHVDVFAEILKQ